VIENVGPSTMKTPSPHDAFLIKISSHQVRTSHGE